MTVQIVATQLDVLCGRDKVSFNHAGNRRFRQLISSHLHLYNAAPTRKKKTKVVISVVEKIRASGGRFLKYNKSTSEWYEASEKTCREKVGHALRDKTPNAPPSTKPKASPVEQNLPVSPSLFGGDDDQLSLVSLVSPYMSSPESSIDDTFDDDGEEHEEESDHEVSPTSVLKPLWPGSAITAKNMLQNQHTTQGDASLLRALGQLEPNPIPQDVAGWGNLVAPILAQRTPSHWMPNRIEPKGDSEIEQGLLELDRKYEMSYTPEDPFEADDCRSNNCVDDPNDNRLRLFLDLASAL